MVETAARGVSTACATTMHSEALFAAIHLIPHDHKPIRLAPALALVQGSYQTPPVSRISAYERVYVCGLTRIVGHRATQSVPLF